VPVRARFVYLSLGRTARCSAGEADARRRAAEVLRDAKRSGSLVARLGLTDESGGPRCAAVRPPAVIWSAG
jgi:hypothetical protein